MIEGAGARSKIITATKTGSDLEPEHFPPQATVPVPNTAQVKLIFNPNQKPCDATSQKNQTPCQSSGTNTVQGDSMTLLGRGILMVLI